jgi:hypothetical protein
MNKLKGHEWNKCGRREGDRGVKCIKKRKKGMRNEDKKEIFPPRN